MSTQCVRTSRHRVPHAHEEKSNALTAGIAGTVWQVNWEQIPRVGNKFTGSKKIVLREKVPAKQIDRGTNNARFTLADPMPRLCPDAVGSANVSLHGIGCRDLIGRPSGSHRAILNMFNSPIGSAVRELFHRGMMHGNQSRPITVTMAISRDVSNM